MPAATIPSISLTVAQQKFEYPKSLSIAATAVDLKALTWGRN